jgi:cation:H+ antiporter
MWVLPPSLKASTPVYSGSREMMVRRQCAFALLLLVAIPLRETGPSASLWTTPCILLASVLITWGAESAQFFIAQGFALAILAWLQTLPEFAVEAVLAWHQQQDLLLANLTGALRLLTGIGWPMIYLTAAFFHRRREGRPLRRIQLERHHSIEALGLALPLIYAVVIWWKASLNLFDAAALAAIYGGYLLVLTKLPPESKEGIEDLEFVPRAIASASRRWRIVAVVACFAAGGTLIYFTATPFLGSLIAVAGAIGIPSFIVIQWFAPVVSEFPEFASTFYFARKVDQAPVAIMNIASSNINQWTLLVAMLPVVFSLGAGAVTQISFSSQQQAELLLTIAQSTLAFAFLLDLKFTWWEATALLLSFAAQFVFAPFTSRTDSLGFVATNIRHWLTIGYFLYSGLVAGRMLLQRRQPPVIDGLILTWRLRSQRRPA